MAKATPITKTEISVPPVRTEAVVSVQLGVDSALNVKFVRAKLAADAQLRKVIAANKKAKDASAAARSEFSVLIRKLDDAEAETAIGAVLQPLRVNLIAICRLSTDSNLTHTVTYSGCSEAKRTRDFKIAFSFTRRGTEDVSVYDDYYAADRDDKNVTEPADPAIVIGSLAATFTRPMSTAQVALLEAEKAAAAEAAQLEAQALEIRQYISQRLPQIKELAIAEAQDRYLKRAEGYEAIYDDGFLDGVDEMLLDTGAALSFVPKDLKGLGMPK